MGLFINQSFPSLGSLVEVSFLGPTNTKDARWVARLGNSRSVKLVTAQIGDWPAQANAVRAARLLNDSLGRSDQLEKNPAFCNSLEGGSFLVGWFLKGREE
jgi:hypothetical protein